MASARQTRRRRRGRRRFGLLFKLLALVAVVAALVFGATVFFQVETVAVSGNQRYTAQEIIDASGIVPGDNLFRMNKNQIKADILRALPYVESVSISRARPSTVVVEVAEWSAVAQVEAGEERWLISVGGKLLEKAPTEGSAAILITGLTPLSPQAGTPLAVGQEEQGKLDALLGLLSALEEQGVLSQAGWVDLTGTSYLVLGYDGRLEVKLPYIPDQGYKVELLRSILENLAEDDVGTLDLTQEMFDGVFTPQAAG